MARSPQDLYARHLVSGRGYPLWTPEPNMNLPDVYVREGLKIGDVGVVVPEDGSFDVFFNVCLSPTHSLHRETGVPNNFTPILLSGRDIAKFPEAERAGRIISTSSVARVRNTDTPDEDPDRRAQPGPLNYEFRLSSREGAILILPEGAERYYLRNERLFLDEAIQHALDWYTFAEQRLGRIISHDALYLITGFYKARSWSLAAYQQGAGTNYAQFRAVQVGGGNATASYTWETTQAMDWRAGPSDQYYNGIPNQTVFIQGFKIAVREGLLRTKRVNVKADFPSVRPYRVEFSSGSWFAKLGSRGSGTSSGSMADTSKGMNTSLNVDTVEGDLLGDESDQAQEDITIHRFPQVSDLQPFHPSDIINQYLLREAPSASIAITHDRQWSVLLERGFLEPEEALQEDCLMIAISSKYTLASHEGAVYLKSTIQDNAFDERAIAASMSSERHSEFETTSYTPHGSHPGASDPPSYVTPPQAEVDVGPKHRQRSSITTFSLTAGWRRSRLETVPTTAPQPQPQTLAFDALVEALSPPAIPSLAHAHALVSVITTQSPLPKAAVLNPLLGSLCGLDSLPQLQCAGYEIMASYWERYEGKVATSDRLAHCSLLLYKLWSPEIGDSRLRALRALTKGGSEAFGIEIPLLNHLKSWIDDAFDAYLFCDPSNRADRERSVELLSAFVSSIFEHPETVARISEGGLSSILHFYASLVSKTLDIPFSFSTSDTTPIASPAGPTEQSAVTKATSSEYKRHSSSLSVRSLPPPSVHPSRHPAELMTIIYLDHLHSQLKSLSPKMLALILPLLFRVQAFLASPLPRLSIMNSHPHGPVGLEERIQKMLHSLFSGPYGASCMMIFEHHLSPIDQTLDSHSLSTSFGAHRTLRLNVRQALCGRMARAYITRLSTHAYTPSGAPSHMDLDKDLMERAWPKDDSSGWDLLKLGRILCKSIQAWAKWASAGSDEAIRVDRDRLLDEAASTLKDIFQEFDDREDREDMNEEEASIAGQTLRHLASFVRPLKNPDDTPMIIPLSQPTDAPTPFLRTLTSLLAHDHSTYMNPSLSATLLFIADHLTDTDTAKLLAIMFEQHDLSPASPDWLRNWESILLNATVFGPTRPLTRLEVMKALEETYDSLKDMHSYRMDLAELVFKFCWREVKDNLDTSADIVMGRILADEVVLRTVNRLAPPLDNSSGPSPYTSTREMIELLKKVALYSVVEDDGDTASLNTSETPRPSPFVALSGSTPNVALPVLSQNQSEYRSISIRDSGLPSVMSFLSTLAGSRSQLQHSQDHPDNPPPSLVSSSSPEPTFTRASLAVVSLVAIFSQLTFIPYPLTQENVDFSVSVFLIIVQTVTDAKCPRARVLALQFLMRLRADRDHRVYFAEAHHDSDGLTANLASLIGRGSESVHQDEHGQSDDALQEDPLSHHSKDVQERDGRRYSRGRGVRPSQSTLSRSHSRAVSPPRSATIGVKWRDALWSVPETLPFITIDADTPSEGIVSYDPVQESPRVIPIDSYLLGVLGMLEKERNWDILSYVLCHLPAQLSNKHLFCGPKCRVLIAKLLTVICSGVAVGDLGSSIEQWPSGLKTRDVQGLAYHTLSVLISYRRCFEPRLRHALVDILREGLNGQPSTVICCLHALTLSAFELTSSVERSLTPLLQKLSQIMSNPDIAVHILSFLSIVGSIPELHANLREEDFKMVFGVALQCLRHHNRPGTTPVISWATSQLPDRPRHIPYITRQLLLANEEKSEVDEPTEVCFDWLARYTYASADPRPANSALSEIVMNPTAANNASSEPAIGEKSWLMGNAIVTIRTLARLGWIEVMSRRPSGLTKFICKLENVPLVGPGEVGLDMMSLPTDSFMERKVTKAEQPNPSEETQRAASGSSEIQNLAPSSIEPPSLPAPDPITGHVWSKTPPSQRRNQVMVDPSFLPIQLSPYPNAPTHRRIIDESALPSLFRNLDRIPVIDTRKVGIMYVAPGQTHELEILRNTYGSPAYTRFLEGIGRLINLRGQVDIYAGGLNPDEDGEYAYAWWDDIGQVLFHTATMMPNAADDEYCVNKKRHIGNDYVRIVWNDGGKPYQFDTLATQFQFLNIVIEPHSLGLIAAFSNSSSTTATPVADIKLSPLRSSLLTPSGGGKGTTTPPHEAEHEYFKVTVQQARGMKEFTPVGCFKLISAEKLPLLVRQLTLLGDWFANVFERTDRDETEVEVITNWRQRLQVVKRFMRNMEDSFGGGSGIDGSREGGEGEGEGVIGQEGSRNFTTDY